MMTEDLLKTLEDLRNDEFETFKWYLQQRDILEGYQAIKVSKLEKAERRDTVNVMVSSYTLDGALKVTKKVLEKINRNDLVQSLSDTSSGPRVSVDVSDAGETSGSRGTSSSQSEDHKTHDVVPLRQEYEKKMAELEAEIEQMIQERQLKIQEIKHSVDLSEKDADREIAKDVQVFTALKESVERGQTDLINAIKEKQKMTKRKAERFIKELEHEISELKKRRTEVMQLSRSEDHLHLLWTFQSLKTHYSSRTGRGSASVHCEGTVARVVSQLEETLSKEMPRLLEAELKRVQQYAVDVTLDPDTANPKLILSDDGKQVKHGDVQKNLPDNPKRFSTAVCVLAKQSFSSGRFYFEVQVRRKTKWALGVARESINRKAVVPLSPQDGCWTIFLRNINEYKALDACPVHLFLKSRPQKVGVFVDYEEGLVSFYDVDAAALIYSFTVCSFTEKLFPFFCPCTNDGGINSAPLIISPVRVN
ncbi:E3 ubiquitin-protein ligase TRIM39-like isoform X2 [Epinephelus fuscoguttatus]|uniref:E3 ubiquitin-protein ligase TRIM39-like isoform X2 n=1 Tax=Epinephelus fuscoguttatus TaxID=293821 RepID=UPI0020D0ACB7|nr:E3 ubiquitin-protein ligase TRIM39-like isoform X2 [Epinephelus fuscoguttatus]